MLFVHHGLSDRYLTSTARNAYFASGFKQSLGYAFGLWSAYLSARLEISLLTLHSFRSRWSCISPRLSDHHRYGHSLVPLLFRLFGPLGLKRGIPSDNVPADYNGVLKRPRKCIDSDKQASKKSRRVYGSYVIYKQVRVGRWRYEWWRQKE